MAYADFTYYKDVFLGNAIPESDFPRLAERASEKVLFYCNGALTEEQKSTTEVKKCACAIAEKMHSNEQGREGISHESVGSYSVSYKSTGEYSLEKDLYKIAKLYLAYTGLLYRGVV
jgi:hypothetical protein